tara:strand:+ start:254 stop:394 length:141 start_codon:yes stop_codon:yes gene_type:complete
MLKPSQENKPSLLAPAELLLFKEKACSKWMVGLNQIKAAAPFICAS